MAKVNKENTWKSLLDICNELDSMSNIIGGYIPNFNKTSEDESLPENDRTTLSKLAKQFQDIIDSNNTTNNEIRELVATKGNRQIKYNDFDNYVNLVDRLDVRMKISGAMVEAVLQRMNKVVEK